MKLYAKQVRSVLIILLANLLYAATVRFFLMSSGLVTGGVTGMSLALNRLTGLPVSLYAGIFNVGFWILGWALLGKKFALGTLLSTVSYPAFLAILEKAFGDYVLTEDIVLCAVLGGVIVGVALGLVMREEASTGGVDVIPLALNKYFKAPISVTMYVVDVIILLAQIAIFPVSNLLYGIVHILVYSIVLDKVLLRGTSRTELKIISKEYDRIKKKILHEGDRGVTLISAKGGYTMNPTEMVYSVISNREFAKIERMVHEVDPDALVIVSRVTEVSGRGFTLEKKYQ